LFFVIAPHDTTSQRALPPLAENHRRLKTPDRSRKAGRITGFTLTIPTTVCLRHQAPS